MKIIALTAAACAMTMACAPALAGPPNSHNGDAPTIKISTKGLDLATPEGQKMLDQRIERAAKSVCRVGYVRTGTRLRSPAAQKCLSKARASAKRQITAIMADQRRGG